MKLNDEWAGAFNKVDAGAVAALYTVDAHVLPAGAVGELREVDAARLLVLVDLARGWRSRKPGTTDLFNGKPVGAFRLPRPVCDRLAPRRKLGPASRPLPARFFQPGFGAGL
jgi:hypothetical protein